MATRKKIDMSQRLTNGQGKLGLKAPIFSNSPIQEEQIDNKEIIETEKDTKTESATTPTKSNVPKKVSSLVLPIGVHSSPISFSPFSFALAPKSIFFSKYTVVVSVNSIPSFSSSVNVPLTQSAKYFNCAAFDICQFLSSVINGFSFDFPSHLFAIPSIISPEAVIVYSLFVFANTTLYPLYFA